MLGSGGQIKLADSTFAGGDSMEAIQTVEFLRTQRTTVTIHSIS
jgi:hypothetical protein